MSYIADFPFRDRLHDVLVWAEVVGRLTEQEVEQVEGDVEVGGWAILWQEYWSWREEVAKRHREEQIRNDAERNRRVDQMVAEWKRLRKLEAAGRLDHIGREEGAA